MTGLDPPRLQRRSQTLRRSHFPLCGCRACSVADQAMTRRSDLPSWRWHRAKAGQRLREFAIAALCSSPACGTGRGQGAHGASSSKPKRHFPQCECLEFDRWRIGREAGAMCANLASRAHFWQSPRRSTFFDGLALRPTQDPGLFLVFVAPGLGTPSTVSPHTDPPLALTYKRRSERQGNQHTAFVVARQPGICNAPKSLRGTDHLG